MNKQIEEKTCDKCLHYGACIFNSEYVPTPCHKYENRAGYRKQEWISVDERLPDRVGKYLVFTFDRRLCLGDVVDHYCDGNLQFDDYLVTHWMPLPKPPKGDKTDAR